MTVVLPDDGKSASRKLTGGEKGDPTIVGGQGLDGHLNLLNTGASGRVEAILEQELRIDSWSADNRVSEK